MHVQRTCIHLYMHVYTVHIVGIVADSGDGRQWSGWS